jgi:hypothetical protein
LQDFDFTSRGLGLFFIGLVLFRRALIYQAHLLNIFNKLYGFGFSYVGA